MNCSIHRIKYKELFKNVGLNDFLDSLGHRIYQALYIVLYCGITVPYSDRFTNKFFLRSEVKRLTLKSVGNCQANLKFADSVHEETAD